MEFSVEKTKNKFEINLLILTGVASVLLFGPYFTGLFYEKTFIFVQLIIAVLWVLHLSSNFKKNGRIKISYVDILNSLLGTLYFISIFFASNKYLAYTAAYRFISAYFIFVLVSRNIRNSKDRYFIASSIFIGGVLIVSLGIFSAAGIMETTGSYYENKRLASAFQYPNTFGSYCAICFYLGMALLRRVKNTFMKILLLSALYLLSLGIVASKSRGTWIIFMITLMIYLIMLILQDRKFSNTLYYISIILLGNLIGGYNFLNNLYLEEYTSAMEGLGLGLLIVIAALFISKLNKRLLAKINITKRYKQVFMGLIYIYILGVGLFYLSYLYEIAPNPDAVIMPIEIDNRIQTLENVNKNTFSRLDIYRDSIEIIFQHPLGTGGGGWQTYYHRVQDYIYWIINSHNYFLRVGIEVGIFGLVIALLSWVAVFWGGYRQFKYIKKTRDAHLHISLCAALCMSILHSLVDFDFSFTTMHILAFAIGGMILSNLKSKKLIFKKIYIGKNKIIAAISFSLILVFIPTFFELTSIELENKARKHIITEPEKAISLYEKAITLSPLNQYLRINLAEISADEYKKDENNYYKLKAVKNIDAALALSDEELWVIDKLLEIYDELGEGKRLGLLEEKAILIPKSPSANFELANAYFEKAIECVDGIPEDKSVYLKKTEKLINEYLGEKENKYIERKLQRKGLPEHYLLDAKVKLFLGKRQEGIEAFEKAFNYGSTRDEALMWRAAIYIDEGNREEAQKLARKVDDKGVLNQITATVELINKL